MKFTTITTLAYALLSFLSLAVFAVPLQLRDVFAPPITNPTAGAVLTAGKCYNVTWDLSNEPKQITNLKGEIHLRKDDFTSSDTLASGFNITLGWVEIIVPKVPNGVYEFVLIGDSGNFSPPFTITND